MKAEERRRSAERQKHQQSRQQNRQSYPRNYEGRAGRNDIKRRTDLNYKNEQYRSRYDHNPVSYTHLFIKGARSGFLTVVKIMPTLIGLMVAVGILRASGFLDFIAGCIGCVSSLSLIHI